MTRAANLLIKKLKAVPHKTAFVKFACVPRENRSNTNTFEYFAVLGVYMKLIVGHKK